MMAAEFANLACRACVRKQKLRMIPDSRPLWRLVFVLTVSCLAACASKGTRQGVRASGNPVELAKRFDLVNVRTFIPDIVIDLRYATADNIAGRAIYPRKMPCLLRRETAKKLKAAQASLRAQGYGICIWDAYRPPEAQEIFHEHDGSTGMFLSPNNGWSRHCGGIAIDLTLVDARGCEQLMPTRFDQDLENASHHYRGSNPTIKNNLQILQRAMKEAGFTQLESEWWHFDDDDFINNPQPVIFARQLGLSLM